MDNSGKLFPFLIKELKLKNFSRLCEYFGWDRTQISKIRSGKQHVSPKLILDIHETIGMPVSKIRELVEERDE